MAYCNLDDISTINPQRTYDGTTKPSSVQVEALIVQVAGEMDSILLGRGIPVPVTAPAAFVTHLKQVNAYGGAALAEMGMFPEAEGTPAGSPQGQRLWQMYSKMIISLREIDLPTALGIAEPFSFFERNPSVSAPIFKIDMVF